MKPREHRQVAEAARAALQAARADCTLTNSEIAKIKRAADEAHTRWIDAVTLKLTEGAYAA